MQNRANLCGRARYRRLFDTGGMILCDTLDDLKRAVVDLSEADYDSRLDFVRQNRITASRYAGHEKNAVRIMEKSLRTMAGETVK